LASRASGKTTCRARARASPRADASLFFPPPYFRSSWSNCGCYLNNSAAQRAETWEPLSAWPDEGCTPSVQRSNESFPIFPALLNALHRGVKVEIMTNYFGTHCGKGKLDMLTFLKLAGATVRYYTTTTFLHTKYMQIDRKKAAVSSVNFSQTSFRKNREAGVVIEGPSAAEILAFLHATWQADFNQAISWPIKQTYSAAAMAVINDKSHVPVVIPPPVAFPGAYVTSLDPVTGYMDVEMFTSPDYAWKTVQEGFANTKKTFSLFIYQVTDSQFCDQILDFYNQGLDFKMLVSSYIFSKGDYERAKQCYTKLYNAGVKNFYKTEEHLYSFSHQKFWILDDTLFLSTGNWGQTDYPTGSSVFPPYGQSGWRNTNRDFTVKIKNADVVAQFQKVLDEDFQRGTAWAPYDA
jgi:PLD-like domain